jgi:tRNA A37 threonylcarbamoyladenosine modification protein TsaB
MEVYAAQYSTDLTELVSVYSLIYTQETINRLQKLSQTIVIGGNGAQKLVESDLDLTGLIINPSQSSAAHICPIADSKYQRQEWSDVAYHTPYYHKSPNITKPKLKI